MHTQPTKTKSFWDMMIGTEEAHFSNLSLRKKKKKKKKKTGRSAQVDRQVLSRQNIYCEMVQMYIKVTFSFIYYVGLIKLSQHNYSSR